MSMDVNSGPGNRDAALAAVKGPAIALIAIGAIGLIMSVVNVIGGGGGDMSKMKDILGEEQAQQFIKVAESLGKVIGAVFILLNAAILYGGVQMLKGRGWGLAFTACILAMIDLSCCLCVLGIPFGIWGIVVLNRAEVKSAFQQS